jgi:hypothetical protein
MAASAYLPPPALVNKIPSVSTIAGNPIPVLVFPYMILSSKSF